MIYWSENMLKVGQKLLYKAFGLSVLSDIQFPELVIMREQVEMIDIEIKIEDLTSLYFELSDEPNKFVVKENLVMFQISDIAIFSIQEGKIITVSPMREADRDQIRLLILGTCMSSLLMQRKIFPLHGSAVAINGKAYAFIGDSGAGKSTLASGFLREGYKLLSDDVIAVSLSKDESSPFVTPSYPQQKLWQDSLSTFGMDPNDYRSIFGRETKYTVPVSSKYFTTPLPLAGVFELVKSENKEIEMRKIEKLESISTLFKHTFRNFLLQDLGLMDWHFHTSAEILNTIDLFQLQRPYSESSVTQLVSVILNTINKGD
jgi:hypothetical protein